jgi:hypothetical protein
MSDEMNPQPDMNDDQVSQDMQSAMNDASQQAAQESPDTPANPVQSTPDGPPQASAPQPSLWKQVLVGALNGLANSAGAKHFGEGAAMGAQGVMAARQQQINNQIKQQQAQSLAQFRDAHAANYASDAALKDAKRTALPQELQDKMDIAGQQSMDKYAKDGVKPLRVIENSSDAANAAMQDIASHTPDGKIPPVSTIHFKGADGKEMIALYDLDQLGTDKTEAMRGIVNDATPIFGTTKVDQATWAGMSNTARNKMASDAMQVTNPAVEGGDKLKGQIENYKAYVKNAQQNGVPDDTVKSLNQALDRMQAADKAISADKTAQATARGAAFNSTKPVQVTDEKTGKRVYMQAGQAEKSGASAAAPDMFMGTDASGRQVAGTQDELAQGGVTAQTKLPAGDVSKVQAARQLTAPDGLLRSVKADIDDLSAKGKLGVVASRWNDFLAGKVGSEPDFQKLKTDMDLTSTQLMQAHVGLKGSDAMLEHFGKLADYHISDEATLRSALGAEAKYLAERAARPRAQKQAGQ